MRSWAEHALSRLQEAGLRRGGARVAVIELLAEQPCAMNALEIEDELRKAGESVARASIYRALEQLEDLGLIRRVEVGKGTASYEPVDPEGHHHHHFVCNRCGRVFPFEDRELERAISKVERNSAFAGTEHEVTIRGSCPSC